VLLFTFQAEAEGFFVETAKFLGGFHPFGKSFGKGGALTPGTRARWRLAMASQRMSRLGSKDQ
jgi:hypothetical protein